MSISYFSLKYFGFLPFSQPNSPKNKQTDKQKKSCIYLELSLDSPNQLTCKFFLGPPYSGYTRSKATNLLIEILIPSHKHSASAVISTICSQTFPCSPEASLPKVQMLYKEANLWIYVCSNFILSEKKCKNWKKLHSSSYITFM